MLLLLFLLQVYKSAFQFQFREPDTTDIQQMDNNDEQAGGGSGSGAVAAAGGGAGDAGEDISSEAKESGPGLLELSKPSEFRLKALKQQKYLTFNKGNAAFASFVWGSVCFLALGILGNEKQGMRLRTRIQESGVGDGGVVPALYWFYAD